MYNLEKFTTNVANLTYYINQLIIHHILETKAIENEPYKFLYTLLFKINNGLDTINLLTVNLYSKPHFADSIFILLRTFLSDCIIYDYLLTLSKDDDDLIENIKRLNYDHVDFTIKNLKIYRDAYKKTELEVTSLEEELKRLKDNYFDESGNPLIKKLDASITKAVKYIINNKTGESIDLPIDAFHYYDIFSKYEHLGDLTFILIHRQFKDNSKHDIFLEIYHSINIITHYMSTIISAFLSGKSDANSYLQDIYKLQYEIEHTDYKD